jgi:NADPH2:quinone reductase
MPRAVVCRELGPPEKLTLEDVARAPLAPGQVRVAIHAAGLNFPDILMAAGDISSSRRCRSRPAWRRRAR